MSDTFCWCGSEAYLSCVFYVVSDVRCSHRAFPTVFSVQIITTSPITELLSRFNCFKGKLTKKKQKQKMTYPCLRGSYLMPHFWIIPLFIGLDISHHALVMRFADFVIFPEFVLNSVPVVFSFLSTSLILWDDMSEMAAWTGWHQRGWKVPNGHSCSREYHLWIHALRTKNDVKADVCFLILQFYLS